MLLSIALSAIAGEVSITVYNNNRALVHEERQIDLQKGEFTYNFTGVPALIDPTSVLLHAEGIEILEQNYEFDIASPRKIIEKMSGQRIRVIMDDGSLIEGKLFPTEGQGMIVISDDKAVNILNEGQVMHYSFPQMPEGFVEEPTLIWHLLSAKAGKKEAEVTYLTGGMSWHAEYIAVVGDKALGYNGWVSIENRSGQTYNDAGLKLMAGDIHTVDTMKKGRRRITAAAMEFDGGANRQFEEESFFEYHLYTLQRKSTVRQNEIKQISLFPEAEVKYNKEFVFEGSRNKEIGVFISFKNSESSGLGLALPAGKVRVYQQDDDASLEFIGEDMIDHTPRDEKVRLKIGNAFDLVGERIVKDTRQLGRYDREEDVEISLRNHKDSEVTILVKESFYGNWKILNSNIGYKKTGANTLEFNVVVPPHRENEELLLKFTVRYSRS